MKVNFNTVLFILILFTGCSSLTLQPGDFAWPVESVTKVDASGAVVDNQYYFTLNVKNLLYAETQDSVHLSDISIRIIRDGRGFYYITASKFKNVYVFQQIDGGLKAVNTIPVSKDGLINPYMNQRPPYIQLEQESGSPLNLTKEGVVEGVKQ